MKIFTLMGNTHYEGDTLLGSFANKEDLMKFVQAEQQKGMWKPETLGYDDLHVYEHQLGQAVDNMEFEVLK